jgi:hypothetical protein
MKNRNENFIKLCRKSAIGETDNCKLGCMFPLFGLAAQGHNGIKPTTII